MKTLISRLILLLALLFLSAVPATSSVLAKDYLIEDLQLEGNERTSRAWLQEYLSLSFPLTLTDEDLESMRSKLLTTGVFSSVDIQVLPVDPTSNRFHLIIKLAEKWTTIPVVRGAYGGGTPLRVVGVYDSHSFGHLWTLGGEMHQYGEAPPGFVVWARAPRWKSGRHVVGGEIWREFRVRTIYDNEDKALGHINTDTLRFRGLFLAPVNSPLQRFQQDILQIGFDWQSSRVAPSYFIPDDSNPANVAPDDITLESKRSVQSAMLAKVVYDNIRIDNILMDGTRLLAGFGPLYDGYTTHTKFEHEAFFYKLIGSNVNLAGHYLVGSTNNDRIANQYFLGGLDSVRGIPDGALYGNHAAYVNTEARFLVAKYRYTWFEPLVFLDSGGAGEDWRSAQDSTRTSVGAGIRIAIPQVYRMVFRIDYAWDLNNPGAGGISAGLNELFQPYPPLK